MKNDAISAEVEPVAVDRGLDPAGGQVFVVVGSPVLGQRGGVGADVDVHLHELFEVGGQIRVAEPENHVGPVEDSLVILLRNPHYVADDLQRQRPGQFGHQVGAAVRMILDQRRAPAPAPNSQCEQPLSGWTPC